MGSELSGAAAPALPGNSGPKSLKALMGSYGFSWICDFRRRCAVAGQRAIWEGKQARRKYSLINFFRNKLAIFAQSKVPSPMSVMWEGKGWELWLSKLF